MTKDGFLIHDNYHDLLYKYDATFITPTRCSDDFGMYGPFCNPRPSPLGARATPAKLFKK